ncbi:MAG: serine hydrolase domain-containing protein, partial [Planctomycetota bacterium]
MTTDNRIDALEPRVRALRRVAYLFCRLFAAGLFVVATSMHSVPVTEACAQAAAALVQKIIDARVEAELAPAIVVGIVRKDGTKEFYCAGKLKAGGAEQVDENTIFEIGSISKVLTTLLMAQMEEQGDLEFSDHAQGFLPAGVTMPIKEGISQPSGETPPTHITLEHLATH